MPGAAGDLADAQGGQAARGKDQAVRQDGKAEVDGAEIRGGDLARQQRHRQKSDHAADKIASHERREVLRDAPHRTYSVSRSTSRRSRSTFGQRATIWARALADVSGPRASARRM